jgi:hypothetical protein
MIGVLKPGGPRDEPRKKVELAARRLFGPQAKGSRARDGTCDAAHRR